MPAGFRVVTALPPLSGRGPAQPVASSTSASQTERKVATGAVLPDPNGVVPYGVGVYFRVTPTDPEGDTARMEVELHQLPASFTGTPNYVSPYVSSGSVATTTTATGLAAGNYGWRYRVVDSGGHAGVWVTESNPDFTVQPQNQSPTHGVASQVRADTGAVLPDPNGVVPYGVGVYFRVTPTDPDGDTARMEVELHPLPASFTGTANYVSPYVSSGSVATTTTATGLAAGNYGWRYRVVDSLGNAGTWVTESNPDFTVQPANQPPTHGVASQVREDTGAVLPDPNGSVPYGVGVYFRVTPTDPDGDTARMEVELHQLPASFTGTPNYASPYMASGSVATTATATGLASGNYGWRYRVVDSLGNAGTWVTESNPDFTVDSVNHTPTYTLANQYRADTGGAIPLSGGVVPTGVGVYFKANVSDQDGDTIRYEVELHQLPASFTGTANYVSTYVASGSEATTTTATGLAAGNYGWKFRVVDSRGAANAWSSAGNPDFVVQAVANQPPTHGIASQVRADTGAVLADPNGVVPSGVGVYFRVTPTDPDGDTARMEVELHPLPATFTGTPNYVSPYVASGSVATTATASGLAAGNYGWRYRVVDIGGHAGLWVAENNPDFTVQIAAQPVLSVSPATPPTQPASAGSLTLNVLNTGGGTMSYSAAVTSGSSWLSIYSGASGGNSGTMGVSYTANPGTARAGTIVVTASGASGSPATITVNQAASGGTTVLLPGAITYIRQIHRSDMQPNFNSANACGPCSAVMLLTYYNRLSAHPMIGQSGQNNDYSWYVAPIDQNGTPSATAYSYNGFTFNIGTPDIVPGGTMNYGAFGYLTQDHQSDPMTGADRAAQYFWKHGLFAAFANAATEADVRAEIDAGRPVFLSAALSSTPGHIMVIRGYNPTQLIAADPWVRTDNLDRDHYAYTWADLHYNGATKSVIKSLAPINDAARVQAVTSFNVRVQPSLTANLAGPMRAAGQLGTIALDSSKNSTFWNADGYTWVKVLWDTDQVLGWSALGSGSTLWIQPINAPTTKIIALIGALSFGNVTVGNSEQLLLKIANNGTSSLTVNGIAYPSGFSGDWPGGLIPPQQFVNVTVTFNPSSATSYGGNLVVNSDATSGTGNISVSGTGVSVPPATSSVTPSAGANGAIVPSTPQTVNNSGAVSFTAVPATGYVVEKWLVNATVAQASGTVFTLTNVLAPANVAVAFKAMTPVPQLTEMKLDNGNFQFLLNGTVGTTYAVYVSSDLLNWSPLSTNTIPATGPLTVFDPTPTQARRFYRAAAVDAASP